MKVISYSTPTPTEQNYHLHSVMLEFLTLKWAVCDKGRTRQTNAPCTDEPWPYDGQELFEVNDPERAGQENQPGTR